MCVLSVCVNVLWAGFAKVFPSCVLLFALGYYTEKKENRFTSLLIVHANKRNQEPLGALNISWESTQFQKDLGRVSLKHCMDVSCVLSVSACQCW